MLDLFPDHGQFGKMDSYQEPMGHNCVHGLTISLGFHYMQRISSGSNVLRLLRSRNFCGICGVLYEQGPKDRRWLMSCLKVSNQRQSLTLACNTNSLKSFSVCVFLQEMNKFRTWCSALFGYDWVGVPLVYTQVKVFPHKQFLTFPSFANALYISGSQ